MFRTYNNRFIANILLKKSLGIGQYLATIMDKNLCGCFLTGGVNVKKCTP